LPNAEAASYAVFVLGRLKPVPPAVLDTLLAASDSPSPRVRRGAAQALGECADSRGASRLIELLTDEEEAVRSQAKDSLIDLGPAAADALIAALDEAKGPTLETILDRLRFVNDPRAADRLVRFIEDDKAAWGTRLYASMALAKIRPADPRIVDRLLKLMESTGSPEASNRASFAAQVLVDLNAKHADGRLTDALSAYQERITPPQPAPREVYQVGSGGPLGECEVCKKNKDCSGGRVCGSYRPMIGGEVSRRCAFEWERVLHCSR
jgi:HEAT repeat protein